jgi:hypothetical protein
MVVGPWRGQGEHTVATPPQLVTALRCVAGLLRICGGPGQRVPGAVWDACPYAAACVWAGWLALGAAVGALLLVLAVRPFRVPLTGTLPFRSRGNGRPAHCLLGSRCPHLHLPASCIYSVFATCEVAEVAIALRTLVHEDGGMCRGLSIPMERWATRRLPGGCGDSLVRPTRPPPPPTQFRSMPPG